MKIRFTETYRVKDARGKLYTGGEVYDLPESTARHFLKRGRAQRVMESRTVEKSTVPAEIPKPPPPAAEKEIGAGRDARQVFSLAQENFRRKYLEGN